MSKFKAFADQIRHQVADMQTLGQLFETKLNGLVVWEHYLAAFPEGTNPLYRVRTEHDGSYDRQFIKTFGSVVAFDDNYQPVTIWDAPGLEYPYNEVAATLSKLVKDQYQITGPFFHYQRKHGLVDSVEEMTQANGEKYYHTYYHFNAVLNNTVKADLIGGKVGDWVTNYQVAKRGLAELTDDSIKTVLDLIESDALYRGEEHRQILQTYQSARQTYQRLTDPAQAEAWIWVNVNKNLGLRIRNSSIGTLLDDLSNGRDLEKAVNAFETKVAPANYKRPTAVVTKRMIENAMSTIRELGYESALERRMARLSDVSINDVLWADQAAKPKMLDGLTDKLIKAVEKLDQTLPSNIDIDSFLSKVVPKAAKLELFYKSKHRNNLAVLTAPVNQNPKPLFKWGSDFGWSYNGDVADSIRDRVKAAGGRVDATMRVSLAWFNYDDLDIHARQPDGVEISFSNRGGVLDVDMNAGRGVSREPVENLAWNQVQIGTYHIWVHNFSKRETSDVGFELQVQIGDRVIDLSYPKAVPDRDAVNCLAINVTKDGQVTVNTLNQDLVEGGRKETTWGITSSEYVPVKTLMLSPNHWSGRAEGNRHWFFILDQCAADVPVRGIYNEFLSSELQEHRKVFELLGSMTRIEPTADQLAGLGFSSTRRDEVTLRVTTHDNQVQHYNVSF